MLSVHELFLGISVICFAVLTVFIVRLAISARKLAENANIIASSIQKEIEPTLKELKEAAKSINSIAANADNQLKNTKAGLDSFINATSCISGKLKSFSKGILKGIAFSLGLFRK